MSESDFPVVTIALTAGVSAAVGLVIIAWCCYRRRLQRRSGTRSTKKETSTKTPTKTPAKKLNKKNSLLAAGSPERDRRFKGDIEGGNLDPEFIMQPSSSSGGVLGGDINIEMEPPPRPKAAAKRGSPGAVPVRPVEYICEEYEEEVSVEEEEEEEEEEEAAVEAGGERGSQGDDATCEWWFYVDASGKINGPLAPSSMKTLYMQGRIGHTTKVRWLPISYSTPLLEEQEVSACSPLVELLDHAGVPPFMIGADDSSARMSARMSADADMRAGASSRTKKAKKVMVKKVRKVPKRVTEEEEAAAEEEAAREETEAEAAVRREAEFKEWEASEAKAEALKASSATRAAPVAAQSSRAVRGGARSAAPARLSTPDEGTVDGEGQGGAADDSNEEDEQEYWFYIVPGSPGGGNKALAGPHTSGEMKQHYLRGRISDSTSVRMIPFCTEPPSVEEQDPSSFSRLAELCDINGPPFMAAALPPKSPPVTAKPQQLNAQAVRERVNRARGEPEPPPAAPPANLAGLQRSSTAEFGV